MSVSGREFRLGRACGLAIEEGLKAQAKRIKSNRLADRSPENPDVGAVILDREYRVLAKAHRHEFPGLHAEVSALRKVPFYLRSRVDAVVTTLEPCSFRTGNRTFPCANAIIRSGARHVVFGSLDPAIGVRGYGAQVLQDHHIRFSTFPESHLTLLRDLNEPYIKYRTEELERIQKAPFLKANMDILFRDLDRIIEVPSISNSPDRCRKILVSDREFTASARDMVRHYDPDTRVEFRKLFALRCRSESFVDRVLSRQVPGAQSTLRECLLTHLMIMPGDRETDELNTAIGGWVYERWRPRKRKSRQR